ncbi:hypothetical protein [Nevskia ramosa]|uniref:hypothetical protein n=1 Tax=Nevskia ramosa TaxID=64002 RepID=UPI0003B6E6A4|nr:hypothetical protein [Nevskia ramosa]
MKSDHEADFGRKVYKINESLLYKIASEMEAFWQKAERLHQQHQAMSDLALEIEVNAIYAELADAAHLSVKDILSLRDMLIGNDDAMGRYIASLRSALLSGGVALIDEHPKTSGPNNFELLNLGITNTATKLSVLLVQMELRFLEAHLKLNPLDAASRSRLDKAKARFSELAASAGYVD